MKEEKLKGWDKLKAAIEKGHIPATVHCSKATAESALSREHFEFFDAFNIKLRLNAFIPYRQLVFLAKFDPFLRSENYVLVPKSPSPTNDSNAKHP